MPPGDIGFHRGGDIPPPLSMPPNHAETLRSILTETPEIPDRPSPIRNALEQRAVNKAEPEIAQQKSASEERLDRALDRVQRMAEWLKEAEDKALELREAERELRETEQSGQSTIEFHEKLAQIRKDDSKERNRIPVRVHNLKHALGYLEQAIEGTIQGLPEAPQADKPETRPGTPSPEQLSTLREEARTLREQLR